MKTFKLFIAVALFAFSGSLVLDSCRKEDRVHPTTFLLFNIPQGFPSPLYNFTNNPLSEEAFVLGRKLFYDGRLSKDGSHSCSSCHNQTAAFTTFQHDLSHGLNGMHTERNAPGFSNLAWYPYFNQDGGRGDLESLIRAHIISPVDMGETMTTVVKKLEADTTYRRLFEDAYGSGPISGERVTNALKQFLLNLVSAGSKYDKVLRGESVFTSQEMNGYTVFKTKCATCHKEPLFTDFSFRNNGLAINTSHNDYGRMRVTNLSSDALKFRVPSLRNLALTSFYSHDGRFSAYRLMILHYKNGIVQSPTLDPLLQNGIALTTTEEDDLVVFLQTLSDSSFINNPRFHE